MGINTVFTNGVIAVREKNLLKDKILRMCESSPEDAMRILNESGFGGGAAASVYEFEKLVTEEERALDEFIREYSPTEREKAYFLSPRDFFNAESLLKAEYLNISPEGMLAPEGLIPISDLKNHIADGAWDKAQTDLAAAVNEAKERLEGGCTGAELGGIFGKATFKYLARLCKTSPTLKKLVAFRADFSNILAAFRGGSTLAAQSEFVQGGRLTEAQISAFLEAETGEQSAKSTPYEELVKACYAAKSEGKPLTGAEKIKDSLEMNYFYGRRFALKAKEPFLYYVFRRKAEIENVRIVFVCLLAGMGEADIKKRLRLAG